MSLSIAKFPYKPSTVVLGVTASIALYQVVKAIIVTFKTTRLHGPPADSFVFGMAKQLANTREQVEIGALYESWAREYGSAFTIRGPLGTRRIVLFDAKAIAHVCGLDTWKYAQTPIATRLLSNIHGYDSMVLINGEPHKNQRKLLNPAFSVSSIKSYTSTFLDIAHKVKNSWDGIFQAAGSDETIIDVSISMEGTTLDAIGIAAFSHDFKAVQGKESPMTIALRDLGNRRPSPRTILILLFAQVFPSLLRLPMPRNELIAKFSESMGELSEGVLEKARNDGLAAEKSVLGVLLKSENVHFTEKEVQSHMKSLLFGGNETTAVILKWALIELARHPEAQDALRAELRKLPSDPTYEDFTHALPYLDAVSKEVLRLHSFGDVSRVAMTDDVIPLSQPTKTTWGRHTNTISVVKGSILVIPLHGLHYSRDIWGPDAHEFNPGRWIAKDGLPKAALEYTGYNHLMTFLDGPRICLGRLFSVMELKAVLAVLVRHYQFRSRDGPATKYTFGRRIVPHPMVAGEQGTALPLRVTKLDF